MRAPSTISRCLLAAAMVRAAAALGAQPRIDAPAPLDALLQRHLEMPGPAAEPAAVEALRRDVRRKAADLLATEGYFSPEIRVHAEEGALSVSVLPGSRTRVSDVSIEIRGPATPEGRQALRSLWPLSPGMPFRDADWRAAKQAVLSELLAVDFPMARLAQSRAEIDPASAQARLHVVYETGPPFAFGELRIDGLSRYSPDLVRRQARIEPGARYDREELLALQGALQRAPWFSSASVEIARPDPLPESGTVRAPVLVHVREQPPHRLSFGVGASTDTGLGVETIYRGLDFMHRTWQLDTGLRLEQLRQSLYADIHLPPEHDRRDGFGMLVDHEEIQGLRRRRFALGTERVQTRGTVETRYALNWQREFRQPEDATSTTTRALTLDGGWTVRRVDDVLDPRRGFVLQLRAGGAAKAVLSDRNFLRLHARIQQFLPIGNRDTLTLRGELGATLASGREGIPEDFLFRAGGAQSVRGYGYQRLGVREGNAIVGGRYLAVASAEYTHWLDEKWGAAAFIDAGTATDDRETLKLATGVGAGARWRSPAGPLAVDLAYGERDRQWRLHFSLAIAF